MNFEKMISNVLRGDYVRKHTYSSGYGKYTNNEIRAREFNLDKAESYFELAGWSERGPDGFRVKDGAKLSLVMTYSSALHTDRLSFLREEAKKAGVDLQLRLLDPAAAYKNQIEKKHQIAWGAWGTSLRPQYYGGYHSDNAHKPQTNNITNTDDPEMDDLIMGYRDSRETDERAELARQIQQKIHDIGAYIPAYDVPYVRHAYWRWVMLPEHIGTRLSDSLFDAVGLGLFWLDQKEKARTEQAMSNNETFEPVIIIDDQFKTTK
jgi:microcin C transport system substrate-binding protein